MGSDEFNLPPLESLVNSTTENISTNNPERKLLMGSEYVCPLLERKEGNGKIFVDRKKITCEHYSKLTDEKWITVDYSKCDITNEECPYSTI